MYNMLLKSPIHLSHRRSSNGAKCNGTVVGSDGIAMRNTASSQCYDCMMQTA
jgi:hypothetical protein